MFSWSVVRFHHCVLLPQECVGGKGGSCDYDYSGVIYSAAVRICESGMPGMLGKIAVGRAGLVQFREAGTLVLE